MEGAAQPFAFTLYPGGGFRLDGDSAAKIRRLTASAMFRGMIVTQQVTRDFVLEHRACDPALMHMIWGVPLPLRDESSARFKRIDGKPQLDVVFAAHKYSRSGRDKGYDTFVEAARRVAGSRGDVTFHVIGPWGPEDYPLGALQDRILFHGPQSQDGMDAIFAYCDVIVSPNRPFLRDGRDFDGFVLASVVQAAAQGVVMVVSDELGEKGPFRDGEDLIIVDPDAATVAEHLIALNDDPAKLAALSRNGERTVRTVYSHAAQVEPRIQLLERFGVR